MAANARTDQHPKTAADLKRYVEQSDLPYAKVGVFDIDGVLRGKYMAKDKLLSSLEGGYDLEGLGRSAAAHVQALGED